MKITLEKVDKYVAMVTIDNQPRLNAMTRDMMMRELVAAWDELEADDMSCIGMTGEEERGFYLLPNELISNQLNYVWPSAHDNGARNANVR